MKSFKFDTFTKTRKTWNFEQKCIKNLGILCCFSKIKGKGG